MVRKRKDFPKTDLAAPTIEHVRNDDGHVTIPEHALPPAITLVRFPETMQSHVRAGFDFGPWYGQGIDSVVYACQRQIERFLTSHDGDLAPATIVTYCENGLTPLFRYCALVSETSGRKFELADINREFIEGFLAFLDTPNTASNTQRSKYQKAKAVLVALGKRGIIKVIPWGEEATFPPHLFPNSNRKYKGAKPLSSSQRKAFAQAVKTALMPLFKDDAVVTGELVSYALLVVALRTGRNTTPLLEMRLDCLRPHPKEGVKLLVVEKRRGNTPQRVPVPDEVSTPEDQSVTTPIYPGTVRLIERMKYLTLAFREDAPDHLKESLWIYKSKSGSDRGIGSVVSLGETVLASSIRKLVATYGLKDADGLPLHINVSILRKTFGNRVFELADGDLITTATALGNSPKVAGDHYLAPGAEAEKNWRFMGSSMHDELLRGDLRATEKTPTGRCTDNRTGQFAPKTGAACMNFLDCLRCRNYVVTGDDLYRLLSFYWLIVRERDRVDRRKWRRKYAHIIRMIDRDVLEQGVTSRIFTARAVKEAKEEARTSPHPFWADPTALEVIE